MSMDTMYRLEEMCCRELDKIVERGELSTASLQQAHLLTDTVKNVYKIEMLSGESSQDGGQWQANGSYDGGNSGNSYANRGQHYVRGHYSRAGNYGRETRRYSQGDEREDMLRNMQRMASAAQDPDERKAYERAMEELRRV